MSDFQAFKYKLVDLFHEVQASLFREGFNNFAKQLESCQIQSCSSFASDDSAFDLEFIGYNADEIEDSFSTGNKVYTVMVTYSTSNKVIGLLVIGCEHTELQKQLMAACN